MQALFSYGTLQHSQVQLDTFGRLLEGEPDALIGYQLGEVEITDAAVIASSGKTHHPILNYTGDHDDIVHGTVFSITDAELAQADEYEVDAYQRVSAPLQSGNTCWIYAAAESSHD
ncbi:gamma-glutamylcyclotransferase family protein [Pseudoalteromonas sp. MMG012]|uniref:gamma-glutamylcyclotransferase family protein n=1 Tax=Pseudoalteromonas sp. MMG012 TaxID=2822686 RepID=UPI001B39F908|nr:gamma-glutamylcyclotransferase family protein [Pseudoalteromonas sp. MMG012]MBQ4850223.1 gamma-glutamylcyclotransferase [Pseudoalteromonas sp. MMG012]